MLLLKIPRGPTAILKGLIILKIKDPGYIILVSLVFEILY